MSRQPQAMCWMPSPLYCVQVFFDLALLVGALVDRDADLAVGAGQRAGKQAGVFALDVEIADLAEIEDALVEARPDVHAAAPDIVGEVVEVVEALAHRRRVARAEPIELRLEWRALGAVRVEEVEQRVADALDGSNTALLLEPVLLLCGGGAAGVKVEPKQLLP